MLSFLSAANAYVLPARCDTPPRVARNFTTRFDDDNRKTAIAAFPIPSTAPTARRASHSHPRRHHSHAAPPSQPRTPPCAWPPRPTLATARRQLRLQAHQGARPGRRVRDRQLRQGVLHLRAEAAEGDEGRRGRGRLHGSASTRRSSRCGRASTARRPATTARRRWSTASSRGCATSDRGGFCFSGTVSIAHHGVTGELSLTSSTRSPGGAAAHSSSAACSTALAARSARAPPGSSPNPLEAGARGLLAN